MQDYSNILTLLSSCFLKGALFVSWWKWNCMMELCVVSSNCTFVSLHSGLYHLSDYWGKHCYWPQCQCVCQWEGRHAGSRRFAVGPRHYTTALWYPSSAAWSLTPRKGEWQRALDYLSEALPGSSGQEEWHQLNSGSLVVQRRPPRPGRVLPFYVQRPHGCRGPAALLRTDPSADGRITACGAPV